MKSENKAHHHSLILMGCSFVLTAVHECSQTAWDAIRCAENEIVRIESLISSWQDSSQTTRINSAAGAHPVTVDEELFALIKRSLSVSELTCGAFDISGTLARYYYEFNKTESSWPLAEDLQRLEKLIDFRNIILNESDNSVFLLESNMKIGFGGIGKGYAAQRAKQIMQECAVENGLINASGDLLCWGHPPNDSAWQVAIPDPRDRNRNLLDITLEQGAVVTSGSYES